MEIAEVEMLGNSDIEVEMGKQLQNQYPNGMPILRIGLIENRDFIEFRLNGRFSAFNDQGVSILKDVASTVKWRVKIVQHSMPKYIYNILLGKFLDRQAAQDLEYQLIEKGIGTRIKIRGGKLFYNDRVVNDNTQFWVVIDDLNSEQEALTFAKQRLSDFSYQIIKEKVNEPHAILELFDSEFEKLGEAENVIRIVPESPEVMTFIYDLMSEDEISNRVAKYRSFVGPLEFRSSNDGKIIIVCELPLEKYVESVTSLLVKPEFPLAAVQAQAIAIRSKTIASLGIKHVEDTFHLCSSTHCQFFNGLVQSSEIVTKAIRGTMGMVLKNGRQVIDANYSLICGGHTESYHTLNEEGFGDPYPPIYDGPNDLQIIQNLDLATDENLNKWVQDTPDVFCNLLKVESGNHLNHIRKQFRWQISYERQELEEILSTKTGYNIGVLYDIIPIRRGTSGRILEIEVLASNQNIVLNNEQTICQTFANDRLPSSCFGIERQFDDNGFPIQFIFYGAGSGHGVGYCQAGGIAMAFQGKSHHEILSHYFKGIDLKKIY